MHLWHYCTSTHILDKVCHLCICHFCTFYYFVVYIEFEDLEFFALNFLMVYFYFIFICKCTIIEFIRYAQKIVPLNCSHLDKTKKFAFI